MVVVILVSFHCRRGYSAVENHGIMRSTLPLSGLNVVLFGPYCGMRVV